LLVAAVGDACLGGQRGLGVLVVVGRASRFEAPEFGAGGAARCKEEYGRGVQKTMMLANTHERLAVSLYTFLLAMTWSTFASAREERGQTSSLSWVRLEGAESCIGTQALARAVEERLKRKVFVSVSEADVSVEGHVAKEQGRVGWRAQITVRDTAGTPIGTREVTSAGRECSSLDESMVLVIAVMIDPEAEREPPPEEEPMPPPAVPPVVRPQIIVQKEKIYVPVVKTSERPWLFEARAAAASGFGLIPGPAWGATVDLLVEPRSFWAIDLAGAYWADSTVMAERGAEAKISLAYGALFLCPIHWVDGRASLRWCAGGQVGTLRGRGVGFDTQQSAQKVVVHVAAPACLSFRVVGPVAASLGLALVIPLRRAELTYRTAGDDSLSLFEQSPVGAVADLGLAVHFP